MKRNLSNTDRIVRLFIAILLLVLFIKTEQSLTINWLLLAGTTIMLGTIAFSYCPLYKLLGFSTYHHPKSRSENVRKIPS